MLGALKWGRQSSDWHWHWQHSPTNHTGSVLFRTIDYMATKANSLTLPNGGGTK